MAGVQVLHPTDLPLWCGRDAGHRRHLPLSAQGHCEVWMQHRAAHGKAVNQETPDALQCNPQAVLCVTCSRGLGTDAQMLQINTTKSWEVSAEDIFPFMRTWGGEGGTWWGAAAVRNNKREKGEGGERERFLIHCQKLPKLYCQNVYIFMRLSTVSYGNLKTME